ncbi:hypothetical protein [Erwinia mallotivora]|uniref:Uncharacterized protein n=1 Tax=Erwinia mallotivora TaxID=69222 RepID=A0A014ME87_9GAMM|nr:hypothetical protein [Erwinia mallotivora]EXU76379.1 hypothetical protein BG55_05765 [Erwinia mallotivora]
MRILKITLSMLVGAMCGAGLMFLLMPLISRAFVGPIHGEDQMSANFEIFFIGTLMLAVPGAIVGWMVARRLTRQ